MKNKFYKNKKTKLWDEKISAAQIVLNTEWDFGLDAGEIQRQWNYSYLKEAQEVAFKQLKKTGYNISEIARAFNKSRKTIYKYF